LEIATLRAGRVMAAMLCLCMGERAEETDGQRAATGIGYVAELLAFLALGVPGGGEHVLDSPVSGEVVERGAEGESVGRGQ